jgi:putative ABC transport system substrate-binding protein
VVTRRTFIGSLAGGLLAAPLAAKAQQAATIPRLGLLADSGDARLWEPLRQGLRDLGYVEGKNIVLEYRRSEGRSERLPDLAAELVRLKVDIIVTEGTPATVAAKRATTTIPIVMANTGDPLSSGLVSSLGQPGGNVTGLTGLGAGLATKRLSLLKEAVPKLSRLAFLWNPASPAQRSHFNEVQAGARSLGVTLQALEVRSGDELERAFATMVRERPSALLITGELVHQRHIDRIVAFASKSRLPAMYQYKENVEAGGLMSYGSNYSDQRRRAAVYIDKILKGAKPADLPVEQPTKFELVINLKTAKALGLTIPQSLLQRADQVIEQPVAYTLEPGRRTAFLGEVWVNERGYTQPDTLHNGAAYLGRPRFRHTAGSGEIRRPERPETGSGPNRYMLRTFAGVAVLRRSAYPVAEF